MDTVQKELKDSLKQSLISLFSLWKWLHKLKCSWCIPGLICDMHNKGGPPHDFPDISTARIQAELSRKQPSYMPTPTL